MQNGEALKRIETDAILFDKDGTLIEFADGFFHAVAQIIEELSNGSDELGERLAARLQFDREEKYAPHDSPIIAATPLQIAQILNADLKVDSVDKLAHDLNHRFEELTANDVMAIEGTKSSLQNLHNAGYGLGVATNDGEENAHAHMIHTGLWEYFSFFAGYDSGFGPKPEPGMVLQFAKTMKVNPNRVVMVGDSEFDMMAGRAAGAMCVAISRDEHTRTLLAPLADYVVHDIAQLEHLILG